jgi:hypothetical protein
MEKINLNIRIHREITGKMWFRVEQMKCEADYQQYSRRPFSGRTLSPTATTTKNNQR